MTAKPSTILFFTTLLSATFVFAAEQSFKLEMKDLKVSGAFPLNLKNPVTVSGVDEKSDPYKIQFTVRPQAAGVYQIIYVLERNAKKEKSGSVIIQAGKTAQLREVTEGKTVPEVLFEATVTE